VRVIERQGHREDAHFTEGEPDLEPPEELAVAEVDEETLLEEDLDCRADLEDEVDVEILENSLDHLVHEGEEMEADDETAVIEDLEIEELEDREESLDRILGSCWPGTAKGRWPKTRASTAVGRNGRPRAVAPGRSCRPGGPENSCADRASSSGPGPRGWGHPKRSARTAAASCGPGGRPSE